MRRLAVAVAVVLALGGYAALDIYDLAPGVLTLAPAPDPPAAPASSPTSTTAALPRSAAAGMPLPTAGEQAPQPTTAGLTASLAGVLGSPDLGTGLSVAVRDALTGVTLLEVAPNDPKIPASTLKLLSAAAVDATFAPGASLTTKVVQGAGPDQVVLVAGGDTLLNPGAGDPGAVSGRAGLGDLVGMTVTALRARGVDSVKVGLDLSYAPGPLTAPTWGPAFQPTGITGAVAALGLSSQRATPGHPGPRDPPAAVAAAFVAGLRGQGIAASLARDLVAPPGAAVLGSVSSAPVADQLALALDESDNALTETLTRQAAFVRATPPGFSETAGFVRTTLSGLGVNMAGVVMADASGLSRENAVPARAFADVLQLAVTDRVPGLRETVRRLPIAGLTGTLADRFDSGVAHAAAGVARAKTGTLTGVSSMAGTVVTLDGRLLTFTLLANGVPPGLGTLEARQALDRIVATLASCGCRA